MSVTRLLKPQPKRLAAFSLLELIVSMGIVGIVMVMLSNVLINSILVSQKSIARSFIREEITNISDLITNDIRGAVTVGECDGAMDLAKCDIETDSGVITWKLCTSDTGPAQICKVDANGDVQFASSPNLKVIGYSFEPGFDTGGNAVEKNIILTIVGDHANDAFNVHNVLRQVSISTRNYLLQASGSITSITPGKPQLSVNSSNIVYSTYTSGGLPMAVDDHLTLTSDAFIAGATVVISGGFTSGTDYLEFTPTGGITGSYDSARGILTLLGTDTAGDYQQVLRSVAFRASQAPLGCTASRQITYTVANGGGSTTVSRILSVSGATYAAPSGTLVWYEGDNGTVLSGTRVASWADKSGNTNTAVAYSFGPTYVTNALNGKPVLRFDLSSPATGFTQMVSSKTLAFTGDMATGEIVLANPTSASTGIALSGFGCANSACTSMPFGFAFTKPNTTASLNFLKGNSTFGPAPASTGPSIVYMGKNIGLMSTTPVQFFNGISLPLISGTALSPNFATTKFILGNLFQGETVASNEFNGDIAAVMVFNHNLTATERQTAEIYLAGKWWHAGFLPYFTQSTPATSTCGAPPPVISPPPATGPINLGGACTTYVAPAVTTKTVTANLPAASWNIAVTVSWQNSSGPGDADDTWTLTGAGVNLSGTPALTGGTKTFPATSIGGTVTLTVKTGAATPGGTGMCVSAVAN